jgi:hypothetical protein
MSKIFSKYYNNYNNNDTYILQTGKGGGGQCLHLQGVILIKTTWYAYYDVTYTRGGY